MASMQGERGSVCQFRWLLVIQAIREYFYFFIILCVFRQAQISQSSWLEIVFDSLKFSVMFLLSEWLNVIFPDSPADKFALYQQCFFNSVFNIWRKGISMLS